MRILVLNCGSSSVKAAVIDPDTGERLAKTTIERVHDDPVMTVRGQTQTLSVNGHGAAITEALPQLLAEGGPVDAVGHRVVHGGARFTEPTELTDEIVSAIDELSSLAPLHVPANLDGIVAARDLLPDVPHVAVFDTAFHSTMPRRATEYALPFELAEEHGIRRYGFHGPSHAYVAQQAADFLGQPLVDLRLITCHLGNGASCAAVEFGRSIETSMGMTPLEGLMMGTRSGDVDPGILLHLLRSGLSVDELDRVLNKESGLKGLSGIGNDLRDIQSRAAFGDERCRAAIRSFAHRVRKYIGAYAAVLGGADAIVFTGGIGENSAEMRHRIAQRLDFLGARFDEDRNRDTLLTDAAPVSELTAEHSRCKVLAIKTDEELAIARASRGIVDRVSEVPSAPPIPIAVSARHVHLTAEHVFALFGPGHKLTPRTPISQPGQFACEERVKVVGPKRAIDRVGIIGPVRRATQVEISRTDEFTLGVDAPIRRSGHHDESPGVTLVGPYGSVTIEHGVIQAERHIHMTPDDATAYGVSDGDYVEVEVLNGERSLTFGDVLVRVKKSYVLEMHIDTDEANAADLNTGDQGILDATAGRVQLTKRRSGPRV